MKHLDLMTLVKRMHIAFGIANKEIISFLSEEEKEFRIKAMQEELKEYETGDTLEEELDALIDLIVFALGTVERMGASDIFNECFQRVMDANMKKTLGPNQNKERGSFKLDLIKPKDFIVPTFSDLINNHNESFLEVYMTHDNMPHYIPLLKTKDEPDLCDKFDGGKTKWNLIPYDTLQEAVKVFEYGAEKYSEGNWKKGITHQRAFASMMRHMLSWYNGEELDPESGLPHLAHLGAQTMMLADNIKRGTAIDDRPYGILDEQSFDIVEPNLWEIIE